MILDGDNKIEIALSRTLCIILNLAWTECFHFGFHHVPIQCSSFRIFFSSPHFLFLVLFSSTSFFLLSELVFYLLSFIPHIFSTEHFSFPVLTFSSPIFRHILIFLNVLLSNPFYTFLLLIILFPCNLFSSPADHTNPPSSPLPPYTPCFSFNYTHEKWRLLMWIL